MDSRMLRRAAALFLLAGSPIAADEVFLKNGSSLKGAITRQDDRSVTLEFGQGSIVIQKNQIERIVADQNSNVQDFRDRYRAIENSRVAADYWHLADWCSRNSVTTHLRSLVERAIELDADFDKLGRAEFVARLVASGIASSSIRTWIDLRLLTVKVDEKDLERLRDKGMTPELFEWLLKRQAPPPVVVKEPEPAPAPPAPKPPAVTGVRQTPFHSDSWERAGFPECPYTYPIVVTKNPYPYVPAYYGPYIYYVPYGSYPVITTPPSTGSYR